MMETIYFNNVNSIYEMFFSPSGSCQMDGIISLYNYIMTYLVGILGSVTTALLAIIIIHRDGERHLKEFRWEMTLNNMVSWLKFLQKWTHSTSLEMVWTIIPTFILLAIAVPSFILLYSLDEIVDTQCIIKIVAYQWYWKFEYPVLNPISEEINSFSYLSYMLPYDELTEAKSRRLLEVDTPLILPTNVNIKLIITAKDVLHSFAVPSLGIKMDAVPGWLNQITVHIYKSGIYFGQCSELCGVNHGFMPVSIAAVDFNDFEKFLSDCGEPKTNVVEIPVELPAQVPASPEVDKPRILKPGRIRKLNEYYLPAESVLSLPDVERQAIIGRVINEILDIRDHICEPSLETLHTLPEAERFIILGKLIDEILNVPERELDLPIDTLSKYSEKERLAAIGRCLDEILGVVTEESLDPLKFQRALPREERLLTIGGVIDDQMEQIRENKICITCTKP